MKSYAKVIEAEQFNGDMTSMTEFIGPDSTFILNGDKYTLTTPTDKWNVVIGDYVAKDYYGLLVFKEERFLKEFQEVTAEEAKFTTEEIAETSFMDKVNNGEHISTEELIQPVQGGVAEPATVETPIKKSKFKKDEE